jgi:hypothetical protein
MNKVFICAVVLANYDTVAETSHKQRSIVDVRQELHIAEAENEEVAFSHFQEMYQHNKKYFEFFKLSVIELPSGYVS